MRTLLLCSLLFLLLMACTLYKVEDTATMRLNERAIEFCETLFAKDFDLEGYADCVNQTFQ